MESRAIRGSRHDIMGASCRQPPRKRKRKPKDLVQLLMLPEDLVLRQSWQRELTCLHCRLWATEPPVGIEPTTIRLRSACSAS